MRKNVIAVGFLALVLSACGGSDATPASTLVLQKNAALPTTTIARSVRATTTTVKATTTTKAPVIITTSTLAPPVGGCTNAGPCKVGQKGPSGGVVFFAAATPQPWGQYMEVRPELFEKIVPDKCPLTGFETYSAGALGDGIKQLNAVVKACADNGIAANAGSFGKVDAYAQGGYSDWFIPSKDELSVLFKSNVLKFDSTVDLTSGTWAMKPTDYASRSFDVVYGVKKEAIASWNSGNTRVNVEIMSDGSQTYGNPNNRWGAIYIARAFGSKSM